jgi:hypothetical protein
MKCSKVEIAFCRSSLNVLNYLTLSCSYLKPYCMGRKTAFFSAGI